MKPGAAADERTAAPDIAARLQTIAAEIRSLERRYHREPGSVHLVAVSKRQPPAAMRAAHAAGQRDFGENFLNEALDKLQALADLDLCWHFIGAIQSNKTADIARHFDWVHSLERVKIAERLNAQRPAHMAPLQVLIQVNISGEASKSGVEPAALAGLVDAVQGLDRLALRGLMALPAPVEDFEAQRGAFRRLRTLAESAAVPLTVLSMGTTADYAAAIAEGATFIRLGTAVFGARPGAA